MAPEEVEQGGTFQLEEPGVKPVDEPEPAESGHAKNEQVAQVGVFGLEVEERPEEAILEKEEIAESGGAAFLEMGFEPLGARAAQKRGANGERAEQQGVRERRHEVGRPTCCRHDRRQTSQRGGSAYRTTTHQGISGINVQMREK